MTSRQASRLPALTVGVALTAVGVEGVLGALLMPVGTTAVGRGAVGRGPATAAVGVEVGATVGSDVWARALGIQSSNKRGLAFMMSVSGG